MNKQAMHAFFTELEKLATYPWHERYRAISSNRAFLGSIPLIQEMHKLPKNLTPEAIREHAKILGGPLGIRLFSGQFGTVPLRGYRLDTTQRAARSRHLQSLGLGKTPTKSLTRVEPFATHPETLTEVAQSVDEIRNSRLGRAVKKAMEGKLSFKRGMETGKAQIQNETKRLNNLYVTSPWPTRHKERPVLVHTPTPTATPTSTPTRIPAVSRGKATRGSAEGGGSGVSPALLGAGAVGGLGLGYAAYRHLKKKSTDS